MLKGIPVRKKVNIGHGWFLCVGVGEAAMDVAFLFWLRGAHPASAGTSVGRGEKVAL